MAVFDTLRATRQLQEAGFPEPQADALVATFADGFGEHLATKNDVGLLRAELREMEQRLINRMYVMMGGGVAFLTGVIAIATGIIVAVD